MEQPRLRQLYERLKPFLAGPDDRFLFVDTALQKLFICSGYAILDSFDASTAKLGLGNRDESYKTPTGIHRVTEKIGAGAPPRRIFRERRDTGVDWNPDLTQDNFILARILRLEGQEVGLNKGAGIDSFDRCIYIHGTNREALVGIPFSHGCVVLRPNDVIRLFDSVTEGTIVFIDAAPIPINGYHASHLHFVGIFGSGMSALAHYLRSQNVMISGSDRLFENNDTEAVRAKLTDLGCAIHPQDGSGITASTDAICVSTAIEETNPDILAARSRNLPIFHRSDVLASIVASKKTIAVAGTSGKSTVTAMIFEFLTACGKSPSLVSGAALRRLEKEKLIGNSFVGSSDLLVAEADESDGTLVKYRPAMSVILNISKDHHDITKTESFFSLLASQSDWTAVNADDRELDRIAAQARFGKGSSATWRPDSVELRPDSIIVERNRTGFHLPLPGSHNAENLCAALCVCEHLGCEPSALAAAVSNYQGVARRFAVTRTARGVTVVDDFAHNPAKIIAAVGAARGLAGRIIAMYQPHGFGPTRFLKDDYIAAFRAAFRQGDALFLLPIYYAGGTAKKDISSGDIVGGLGTVPFSARAVTGRDELLELVRDETKAGDCVLLMGARDPSLPALAKKLIETFGGEAAEGESEISANSTSLR